MQQRSRREFLVDVGKGMLVASVGPALVADLGLRAAWADESAGKLNFGGLEPLASLMQETEADALMPLLVQRLDQGADLRQLVAAAALANARSFGGQDYVGYHAFMALPPAYAMSRELPPARRALPVLKVAYRNTAQIRKEGGRQKERLHPVEPAGLPAGQSAADLLRGNELKPDMEAAERTFAALARDPNAAYNALQALVRDEVDVHRVVLAYRSWAMLDLTGKEHAHSLLRQSVRYCVDSEKYRIQRGHPEPSVRADLPKLLDQYHLLERPTGTRAGDDAWIDQLSQAIFSGTRQQGGAAVAMALGEGYSAESVGEAISLAATRLVLHDPGRLKQHESVDKPEGSVHGDSVGVHASDAANAWRNIARVTDRRNSVASLVVAAYHTAGQSSRLHREPYPSTEHLAAVRGTKPAELLAELDAAVREKNQFHACAVARRYGQLDGPSRPVFDLLLRYATSEDGALHAEKYYRTVSEEFARTRPAFRWEHVAALARVTASEFGRPAPGYAEVCKLLKI